ncbi:MAG: hypothetical protein K6F23_08825 [Solobacterium sp.]|nr:hypothetical protein [Solobacterium sp.]
MGNEERTYLEKALRTIEVWIPGALEQWMPEYEKDRTLYRVDNNGGYVSVIFSIKENGLRRPVQLVFEGDTVIADCAAYLLSMSELKDSRVCAVLEDESDWLYWETEILKAETGKEEAAEMLVYTNAYTTKAYRRQGLFRRMISGMESFAVQSKESVSLYSVISLDPDIACYGPDKIDVPYIYSMKDEPARLLNTRIIKKVGFEPLKLETDEPVEDGSILWFAVRKATYITYQEVFDYV